MVADCIRFLAFSLIVVSFNEPLRSSMINLIRRRIVHMATNSVFNIVSKNIAALLILEVMCDKIKN
jgi:hypothetical protein